MSTFLFYIHTLGCKINQYESQCLRESWSARGWIETDDPASARVILINTCAVTKRAQSESARIIRRFARRTGARVIATGCVASLTDIPWDQGQVLTIPQRFKSTLATLPDHPDMQIVLQEKSGFPEFSLQSSRRARGVVKVQDGCSHRCTYCIIPFTRGHSVSRPFSAILQEVRRVFSSGIPEVVLSGINLGHFGRDLSPRTDFWDLVIFLEQELASEWAGKKRLRLGSLEPGELNSKGLDTLAGSTMLCPHLHVSLQSASPKVLRAMGRGHYSPDSVSGFVLELERLGLDYVLGADLLVGFPGESDADFSDTLKFCTRLPLGYAHVFPYSVRPGTAAAAFSSQVPHAIRSARAGDLRQALLENRMDILRRIASKPLLTMVPETSSRGICEYYFTCRTEDSSPPLPYGQLVGVRPLRVAGDGADAEIVVQEVSG